MSVLIDEQNLDFALRVSGRRAALKLGEIDDRDPSSPDPRERATRRLSV